MAQKLSACQKCGGQNWRRTPGKVRRCRICDAAWSARKRKQEPGLNLLNHAKTRARLKGIPFSLTNEQVRDILRDSGWACLYCGVPVGSFEGIIRPTSVSLDRLIPEEGYTLANTVVACHQCNSVKGEHTAESLRLWADKIETVVNARGIRARSEADAA